MTRLSFSTVETELWKALAHSQFQVDYQPQVDIRNGKITANEALIRWNHPEWGIVSPEEFIPVAEKSELIIRIGEWVLKTACLQNKLWQDQGYEPMVISVNLSPRQFNDNNLFELVKTVLEETGLPPQYLDLEITEGMTMDVERSIRTLQELKTLGVCISLDDFGKGYSSLYYLKRFPVDTLKIDRSFVRECTFDESDATIVKTIIAMAHNLGLNVVAEGIETREHLVFLQQHLCDIGQGYLFSKPLPAVQLEQYFYDIPSLIKKLGIETRNSDQIWMQEQLRVAKQELEDTLRLQQGMTMKIKKQDGRLIHTLVEGELAYRLGYVPQDAIGKDLFDFLPADIASEKILYYERAWSGEDVSYETILNGVWYMASLRPVRRGGQVVEVIASCVDITKLKHAEEEIRSTKNILESFIDNISDAICIMNLEKTVLRVNQAFETIFGWNADELVGKILPYVPEEYDNERLVLDRIINGESVTDLVTVRKHKNGSLIDVSISVSPIRDIKGTTIAITAVIRDISGQREKEQD